MYSAIKIKGQKMYDAAREGQVIERPPRPVTVTSYRVWRDDPSSQDAHYCVECSKGTYVRSLVHDLVRLAALCAACTLSA